MANWWEEKDELGYTYADKNRPGYMGPVPKEEEVQVSEEEIVDDSAGYDISDFGSGQDYIDSFRESEVTEDDKKFVKNIEKDNYDSFQPEIKEAARQEEMMEMGEDFKMELPKEEITPFAKQLEGVEPQILRDVDVDAEKKIKELMKKAVGAKGKKRSDGYANLYKSLEAYKGKDTPFLKGLRSRFSKKASATKNKQHLGDYVDYFKQGYSWQASRPRRASSPSRASSPEVTGSSHPFEGTNIVNKYSNTIEYDQDSILTNANNFKDGLKIPGSSSRIWEERMRHRPKILIGDDQYTLTSNHMEEGGHSMKDSIRSSQLLLKDGKVIKHPDGEFNYGLDLVGNQGKIKSLLGGKIHKIDAKDRNGKYPTGYGRRLIVETNKKIMVDGKPRTLFVHYAHATGNSFSGLNVGDSLKVGQEVGTMGKTGEYGDVRGMGVHLDLNGYVMVDGKKVYVSPSEFLPKGMEEHRTRKGFKEGGEVEEDSWLKKYSAPTDDLGQQYADFRSGEGESFQEDVSEVEEVTPFSKQIKGYEDYAEMPQDEVGPSPAQQKVAAAESALGHLDQRRKEQEKLNQQKNLIEVSKEQVEAEGPDAEMVRKSYAEIESNLRDVDPKTGRLSVEATNYLAQIPKQTLLDYRETYGSDTDRSKITDVLVKQVDIQKEIDKADSIQLGKKPKPPVRKVSELKYLKIKEYKDREDLEKARTEAINLAMKQSKIDPKRLFKNRSTFDKVVGLLGRVAGLYGSVKYGGPDYYEQYLDKEIAKDIKDQKLDQEFAKRKLAAANFKVAALAKRYALSAASVKDKQNFNKINLSYLAKGQKVIDKQIKEKKKMADLATLNRRGISSNELAYLMAKYPELKLQQSLITARDGKHYYIMGGSQAVKKIKDSLADTQDSIDGLRDLEGYVDKVGIWNQGWAPWSFLSRDRAEAEALRDRLVGKLRIEFFGPGVMTDNEREQAKKILGDPNAFFTTDEREKAKIRSLIMKLNYGMRQKLRRDGLTMLPLSPNENRVTQLLKRNNLGDNPKNRVKIVDSLIEAEKEAVLGGGKAGQFWDMNEPLPI